MKTNWPIKKLGEVAEYINGFAFKPTDWGSKGLPIIRIQNLNNPSAKYNYYSKPVDGKFIVENGDLLISWSASLGVYIWDRDKAVLNQHIFKVIPNEKLIDKNFFLYTIKYVLQSLIDETHGSTMKHITKKKFENVEIPVPPIEEQGKIVKKLEKILAKIEQARTLRQESSEDAQNIIRTKLGELFENNSWDEMRVSDIAEKPQYGYTAPSTKDKIGPRLLRITDIQNGMVDWENVPYCKCNEVDKYRLTSGDIVFARTGATTGKSFLIKDTPEQTVFASYLIRLKTKGSIKQEFLYWFFQSPQYWDQIMGHQRGSAQPNVNAVKLSTIKLRMPENLKKQEKIVTYLDSLSEKVQALQKLQQEQLQELKALQQSVLHQAFQGRL